MAVSASFLMSSEDVGNADPRAIHGGNCGLGLLSGVARRKSERAIFRRLFTWPARAKSNAVCTALKPRWLMLANVRIMTCRVHLRNAPTK
ncbi:hypothetical protein ACLK1Z_05365 [Escherichia coli]